MGDRTLASFLRSRKKVDPDELALAIEEALAAAGGVTPHPNASETLRPYELEVLARGGFEGQGPKLGAQDPVLRGACEYAAMRATALTTKEAAARLRVNDRRVRRRLAERALYGFKVDAEWRLPLFQFAANGDLVPNIDRVLPRLSESLSAIAVLHWFSTPNPDLVATVARDEAVSPIVWLRLGLDPKEVAELASQV